MGLRWLCALLLALPGAAWGDCLLPPRLSFAEPVGPVKDSYAEGERVRYKCRPGYIMAEGSSPEVICEAGSRWSTTPNFCIGKSCGQPHIPNGNFETSTDLQFGATISFTCNEGYRLVGKSSSQCVLEGNDVYWDHIPHCEIIPCPSPPGIENGQIVDGHTDYVFGMVVTYRCNKDFVLVGDDAIHCTTEDNLEGKWSGPAPECKVVRCKNPEVENGRKLSGFGTEYTYKSTVTFGCNPGYVLKGSSVVTCEADSNWKPPLPKCEQVYCGPAPHFPYAELKGAVGDSHPFGTQLTYLCKPGYTAAQGKSSVVTCQSNSAWSADPDFCIRQQCPPPRIENGDVIADNFLFGTIVRFTCHPGYELKKSSAKCVVSGDGVAWDTAPPYCERQQRPDGVCEDPPTINNGMHNGTKGSTFAHGSIVVYKCRDGFTLTGASFLRCMAGDQARGVWSKPTPECRGGANIIIVGIFPLLLAMLVMNI